VRIAIAWHHRRRFPVRGFTLVELLVVVVIAATLSLLAVALMNSHLQSSKSVEGLTMVQSIRAAQERYRSENGTYLDVSSEGGFYPDEPTELSGDEKRAFFYGVGDDTHADNGRWLQLLPTAPGPVRMGYLTNAGAPGRAMTEPEFEVPGLVWPDPTEPWYVIQAVSDLDADGVQGVFIASSLNGEVYRLNEGE
jgi:prepilin-type N-terminal cleavage/methylation domain-containing protein